MSVPTPHWKHTLAGIPGIRRTWNTYRRVHNGIRYRRDFSRYSAMAESAGRGAPNWRDRFPCLGQDTNGVDFDRHYVYHTSWAARILSQTRPARHVDFSSSLYFVGIASAFIPIEHYDFRKPLLELENLETGFADLLRLPFPDESIGSLSCMHVAEHIGLGRYGDPLDPEGDIQAMRELARVLAPGGDLLFVVPVGQPRVCFNAHRIYSFEQIQADFRNLTLQEFRMIPDDPLDGGLVEADAELVATQQYACGCFWFRKPHSSE